MMTADSDALLFADEDPMFFSEEIFKDEEVQEKWKILIVDDEQEVHSVTKMVLEKFTFEHKKLQFLSAYTGQEAKTLMGEHPDIAIVFMDVVMEKDDTGLAVIRYIREEMKNKLVRIILRTGQPGQAPEERVIVEYDINDYKEKTELTSQKLFTSVVASLRAYRDLITLDTGKRGLGKIIDAYSEIFFEQSQKDFSLKVLKNLEEIIDLNRLGKEQQSCSFSAVRMNEAFYILAARGGYAGTEGKLVREVAGENVISSLNTALQSKTNGYLENALTIYIRSKTGSENLIYFEGSGPMDAFKKDLIEVFCANVSAIHEAIQFSVGYETEKKQRLLAETLRDLNRRLTSTLSLEEVMARLLNSLSQIIHFKVGLGIARKGEDFELLTLEGKSVFSTEEYIFTGTEREIISEVTSSGQLVTRTVSHPSKISFMGVPILYNHNLFGMVLLVSDHNRGFDPKDIDLASVFGSQAGGAMENANLYEEVMHRNADIENILDNAGQGFLTFGSDMRINTEYSAECISIFGKRIEGISFPTLIYEDEEQCNCLEAMLFKTISLKSKGMQEIYLPLLPGEIQVNDKYVQMDFKIIQESGEQQDKLFMVVLTDITDKKFLENKVEEERKILKMVVKAVTNQSDLTRCYKDYRYFCETGLHEILNSDEKLEDKEFEVLRSVHTFKGSFSQLDLVNIVRKLHDLETDITDKRGKEGFRDLEELRDFILGYPISCWLDEDLKCLYEVLGKNFLEHEKAIFVDQVKLLEIEKKLVCTLTEEQCELLLPEIKQLRYIPIRELLKHYPDYVVRLSNKLGKSVHPFIIEGGEILVDAERISDFSATLVHVFRNAMDHGIETLEERRKAGKDELGTIQCSIEMSNQKLIIIIGDDGRGVHVKEIKKSAISKGLYNENTINNLSNEQLVSLIFEDCFTTKAGISELSGRGMGLSAVKSALEKAGGTLRVETKEGRGTRFIFELDFQ